MRSDRVVFPESMCAEIPMLRTLSMGGMDFSFSLLLLVQTWVKRACGGPDSGQMATPPGGGVYSMPRCLPALSGERIGLLDGGQLDVENQRGVRRNRPTRRAPFTVGKGGRNGQLALATHLHPVDALLPPLDHHAGAQRKLDGLAAIQGA